MITASGRPKFDSIQLGMFRIDRTAGVGDAVEAEFYYISSTDRKSYGSIKVGSQALLTEDSRKLLSALLEQLEKDAVNVIYGEQPNNDTKEEDHGGEPAGLADGSEEPDQI